MARLVRLLHFFAESGVDCCCACVSGGCSCALSADDRGNNSALDGAVRSKQVLIMRAINVTSEIPMDQLLLISKDRWLTSVWCIAISCLMNASLFGSPSFTLGFRISTSRISAHANKYRFRSCGLADKIVPSSKAAFNKSLFLMVSGMAVFSLPNDRVVARRCEARI
jgi:hypothetical protein